MSVLSVVTYSLWLLDQLFIYFYLFFVSKKGLTFYIMKRKTASALLFQVVGLKLPTN